MNHFFIKHSSAEMSSHKEEETSKDNESLCFNSPVYLPKSSA